MLRIYWRSPLTKYYWWISKFTKSDSKFMEILTTSNKSCQCDQFPSMTIGVHMKVFLNATSIFFLFAFPWKCYRATFWIQHFLSICFQSLYKAVNQCHLTPICISLNYRVGTNTMFTLSRLLRWARYRATRAYHVALLQNICFTCEWRVLNYLISSLTRLTYYIMYF